MEIVDHDTEPGPLAPGGYLRPMVAYAVTCLPTSGARQVIGTPLDEGPNRFVFKVPQTGYYWQILFEPDTVFPYSHPEAFRPLPMKAWRHLGEQER
ncbi:unnamed protein product [marine sediment metagenome]|uniref:Uncharacterized protein n=1 Tax=marine sediment metagenome TaxID=412755 RepID=X0Y953_9ZZZZ